MEDHFQFQIQPPFLSGAAPPPYAAETSIGEAYINGVYDGISFRSLLTYDPYANSAASSQYYHSTSATFFDLPAQAPPLAPKIEPELFCFEQNAVPVPPYNFFNEASSSSSMNMLPALLSIEALPPPPPPPPKNTTALDTLSTVENQRRRRKQQKLSDKTRRLQKLLPWDTKMDMATVLEEAYKYVKFLKAQVSILQSMPYSDFGGCVTAANGLSHESHAAVGDHLRRLNRQQVLQVLLHSPVAQSLLYSRGCCVFSLEQLLFLKKNAERKAAFDQRMVLDNPNNDHHAWVGADSCRFQ